MSIHNLRLKLLKIGAEIIRNSRRIHVLISEAYPHQELFAGLVAASSRPEQAGAPSPEQ